MAKTQEAPGGLDAAVLRVMAEVPLVAKTSVNRNQGYTYASDDDVLNALREKLVEHGLVLYPCSIDVETSDAGTSARGNQMSRTTIIVRWRLKHVPSGEAQDLASIGSGVDMSDKGSSKAMTQARKYALKLVFHFSGEDGDAESPAPEWAVPEREAPKREAPKREAPKREASTPTERAVEARSGGRSTTADGTTQGTPNPKLGHYLEKVMTELRNSKLPPAEYDDAVRACTAKYGDFGLNDLTDAVNGVEGARAITTRMAQSAIGMLRRNLPEIERQYADSLT